MKIRNKFKRCALLIASSSILTAFQASAVNTFYQAGDLILYFQKVSVAGNVVTAVNTVYADLGAATAFRGSSIGATDVASSFNFMNINTTLESAFGPGWANDPMIFAGLAANYSAINDTEVVNGDVSRTVYVSAARNSNSLVGEPDSTAWELQGNTSFQTAAGQVQGQNLVFRTYSASTVNVSSAVVSSDISLIDDRNKIEGFLSTPYQTLGFGVFDGGVQQQGSASSFGSFGDAGDVEFALDLYRLAPSNGNPGQIDGIINGNLSTGSFEGTFTVGSTGNISYVSAIPEPSSLALGGLAAGCLVLRRRRSSK